MATGAGRNGLFASELARAVNALGVGVCGLDVGGVGCAIKNIVSRHMNKYCIDSGTVACDFAHRVAIYRKSEFGLLFRLIDGSIGRGIDDHLWP